MADYIYLWTYAGVEESRAMAEALEFLEYCEATGQDRSFDILMKWGRGGEDDVEGNGGGGDMMRIRWLDDPLHTRGLGKSITWSLSALKKRPEK